MTDPSGTGRVARCTLSRNGTVLSLVGVIDEFNRVEIADQVAAEVRTGIQRLDLMAVTVFGAAGVRVLLHGLRTVSNNGALSVTCTPLAYRVLDICGLLDRDGLVVLRAGADEVAGEDAQ